MHESTLIAWPHGGAFRRAPNIGWITDERGCDIWQACHIRGYGHILYNGRQWQVHRLRYELEVGPIPEGMQLDHFVCDNGGGRCCNPRHCRPVTALENTLRGSGPAARNAAKIECINGHALSGDNVYARKGGRGCRACDRAKAERHRNKDPVAHNARRRAAYNPQRQHEYYQRQKAKGNR